MAAKKLNIINVSLSLCGRYGGKKFAPATRDVASLILTKEKALNGAAFRTKCEELETLLNLSHPTACTALQILRDNEVLARTGQSEYSKAVNYVPVKMDYIPVYTFLYEFTYDHNGKRKHLSKNAILILCLFLRDVFNPKRDEKAKPQYFISKSGRKTAFFCGCKERIATALNISPSTATRAINVLLKAKLLNRGVCHFENGEWTVSEGIGINNDYLSAYIIPHKLYLKVAGIRAKDEEEKQRIETVKQLFDDTTSEQEQIPEPEKAKSEPDEKHYDKYILALQENFGRNAEFKALKNKYRATQSLWLDTFKKYGDSIQSREAETALNNIEQDLLNLLLSFNVQRKALPKEGEALSLLLHKLLTE